MQKKMWVLEVPTFSGSSGAVSKVLEKRQKEVEIRGGMETIQTTLLLKLAVKLKICLDTREKLLPHSLSWNSSTSVKIPKQWNDNSFNNKKTNRYRTLYFNWTLNILKVVEIDKTKRDERK